MEKIMSWLMDGLGDIISYVVDWFGKYLMQSWMVPLITSCKEVGDEVFSSFINSAIVVLQKSPSEWNSNGWEFIIQNVNKVFIAFGSQLVVLFFLIGFFADSVEPTKDIRLETLIRALFKILFGVYLVSTSAEIITTFFGFVGTLTCKVSIGKYSMPEWDVYDNAGYLINFDTYLKEIHGGYFILTLLVAFIYMIVMIGAGGVIAYTAYMRFFKIMLIVPYGALVSSTVAGNHALNHTAIQYYKYVLSVVLEAVTIVVAIGLYTSIMAGTEFKVLTLKSEDSYVLCEFINRALAALLLVGAVKGAGALTQRGLGS